MGRPKGSKNKKTEVSTGVEGAPKPPIPAPVAAPSASVTATPPQTPPAEKPSISCTPPINFKRNEFGLLTHINYVFNSDGSVNWRKMVLPEFLQVNRSYKEQIEKVYGKPVAELKKEDLDDKYLLILLAGIRQLAQLRGFSSIEFAPQSCAPGYAATVCRIKWLPIYEDGNGAATVTEALADAHIKNTNGFAQKYLMAIAENRAFTRCVRNFLRVNIVGEEEIDVNSEGEAATEPSTLLQKLLDSKKIPFEQIKNELIAEGVEKADSFASVSDIPKIKIFELLEKYGDERTATTS